MLQMRCMFCIEGPQYAAREPAALDLLPPSHSGKHTVQHCMALHGACIAERQAGPRMDPGGHVNNQRLAVNPGPNCFGLSWDYLHSAVRGIADPGQ